MCRDLTTGARRCPCDTSAARRQRRKLSKITANLPAPHITQRDTSGVFNATFFQNATLEECVAAAQEIKKRLQVTPETITGDINLHYQQIEKETTQLGIRLGELADEKTSLTLEEIEIRSKEKAKEIYADKETLEKLFEERAALADQYAEIFEEDPTTRFSEEDKEFLDDEFIEIHDKYWDKHAEVFEFQEKRDKEHDAYRNEQAKIFFEEHREAYAEILKTIRPMGGNLATNSDEQTQKLVTETIDQYYPKDWIENSNLSSRELNIIQSEERGIYIHYPEYNNEEEYEEINQNQLGFFQIQASPNDSPEQEEREYLRMKTFIENISEGVSHREQDGRHTRSGRKINIFNFPLHREEEYSSAKHGEMVDNKPPGEGWVKKQSSVGITSLNDFVTANPKATTEEIFQHIESERWVRSEKTKTPTGKSQIRISTSEQDEQSEKFNSTQKAVLFHEFGHRVEYTNPHIPKMEKAFLARRANKNEQNWYKNMIPALGPWEVQEVSHDAGMIDPYMSKEYGTGEAYEVLATGLESLYGGEYGGLVGLNSPGKRAKADLDHRGFILGLLATA